MEYDDFIKLTEEQKSAKILFRIYLEIWNIFKDNGEMSHKAVQKLNTASLEWNLVVLLIECLFNNN